jgi:hypothetical protein
MLLTSLFLAAQAYGYFIQAYAVADHSQCNASNLPGTVEELDKFFASSNFPESATTNFYRKNRDVIQSDWMVANDYRDNPDTASGKDGVDSGLLSYIASHGVTSSGRYSALTGNSGQGGCYIRNTDMGIGDHQARYLILSTCQGLKIGTGDRPTRPGENPSRTWTSGANGLNCIFGYSNNMVDASEYGENFLANLATSDDTLAEAFFRASRSISYSNIPVTLCFGPTEADARTHLETDRQFVGESYGNGASVFSYEVSSAVEDAAMIPLYKPFPARLLVVRRALNVERIASMLFQQPFTTGATKSGQRIFKNNEGTLITDGATVNFTATGTLPDQGPTNERATAVARGIAQAIDAEAAKTMAVTHIVDRFYGTATNAQQLAVKTVILQQKFYGLHALHDQGAIAVTVDGAGRVRGLTVSLVERNKPAEGDWINIQEKALLYRRAEAVERDYVEKFEGATVAIKDVRLGYAMGNHHRLETGATAVVQVQIEVTKGGFARQYLENVNL